MKYQLDNKRPVIIWGTNLRAGQLAYEFRDRLNIVGFIDDYGNYGHFLGKKVFRTFEISEFQNPYYIIISSLEDYQTVIKPQLMCGGVRQEFNDYIYYEMFQKELVMLYGNCHMGAIKEALCSIDAFDKKYYIYPVTFIQDYGSKGVDLSIVKTCDVFIHQIIRTNNPYGYMFSDDYLSSYLKDDCKKIAIPNLYGAGMICFPQCTGNYKNPNNPPLENGEDETGMFFYLDCVVDKALREGIPVESIMQLAQGDVFSENEIINNFTTCINEIKRRECLWDIKVSSFIEEHYKSEKLFYDPGHPTEVIINYIAKEILRILRSESNENLICTPMNERELPVYPCVQKTLDLQWEQSFIREGINGKKFARKMDFDEYIREYYEWGNL